MPKMPNTPLKHPILTDRPADADGLDFNPYIDALAELIADPAANTPLTLGVFGTWGSGKTTLMNLVKKQVDAQPRFKTVWFNAWKYERETLALWRVLILRTLDALRPRKDQNSPPYTLEELADPQQKELLKDLDRLEQSVYNTVEWTELGRWTLDWARALEGTVDGAAEIALSLVPGAAPLVKILRQARDAARKGKKDDDIAAAFSRQAQSFRREQLRSVEQFIITFEQTIQKHVVAQKGRLVIFIDDLDRCLPERAIEVLEAIKLFLDVPGCVFVLGVDPQKVQQGIQLRYKNAPLAADGVNYLEKIIQLPFILPRIESHDMRAFVDGLQVDFPDKRCVDIFAAGMSPNPRQIKRAVNIFLLLWKLAGKRRLKAEDNAAQGERLSQVLTPPRLAKVVVIQHSYPDLYALLRLTPRYLKELEEHFLRRREDRPSPAAAEEAPAAPPPALPPALEKFAERSGLHQLFTLFSDDADACFRNLTPLELRPYLTLAGRSTARQKPAAPPRQSFEPEMVFIPAGAFLMGSTEEDVKQGLAKKNETPQYKVDLPAYAIGKYPVTNAEYKAFVDNSGYRAPIHWEDGQFPDALADHPVTNVSLDDAAAYCKWLAEKTGKPYRLPTEREWERAASWADGRVSRWAGEQVGKEGRKLRYPWGDAFDAGKCNTKESGIETTTPVGQYSPIGDSPAGCADMAGNVWEWTSSDYEAYPGSDYQDKYYGRGLKSLRGGSYYSDKDYARAAFRVRYYRANWLRVDGFRVALAAN